MHIDGDILSRLVMRGSDYLTKILTTQDFEDAVFPENGTARATLELFTALANNLLGESPDQVEKVMRWLEKALHVEF
jgi:hypothetical protein